MIDNSILAQIKLISSDGFKQLCEKIIIGLGFEHASEFSVSDMPVAFQETIERKSADNMFLTKETWSLAFTRPDVQPVDRGLEATVQAAQMTGMQNVFVVVFGNIESDIVEKYHSDAKKAGLRSILLAGKFAQVLAQDYAQDMFEQTSKDAFSFAKLRKRMKRQAQEASWHKQFLSMAALPVNVSKVRSKDAGKDLKKPEGYEDVLGESDLLGAIYRTPSFLLLGDPGAGKTTCLQDLAEKLTDVGGRTPVFLSLNRYEGNLLRDLGEVLCSEADLISEQGMEELLASGAFTVILDGVNEVQSKTLQPRLIEEINALTNTEASTARSHWIVSSRRYDYAYTPELTHLDKHSWELLPLSSNLIYQFLVNGLGKEEGRTAYFALGTALREVCNNPLLLNMLLTVRQESGKLPMNRGALYRQFVDLLLRRGAKLPNNQRNLAELAGFMGSTISIDSYCNLVYLIMPRLASEMQENGTTAIGAGEVIDVLIKSHVLASSTKPKKASEALYSSLLTRGILKFTAGKITFFHHTFQEYFLALKLREIPLEELIPSGGVRAGIREAIVFMASTLDSPVILQALLERVLQYGKDVLLAYEIMRSASIDVDKETQFEIATALWYEIEAGEYVGAKKYLALVLMNMAKDLGQSDEQLIRNIFKSLDEKTLITKLLTFYQETGDIAAEQRLLSNIDLELDQDIPDDLLFRMAITAYNQKDYEKAIELYTKYIKPNPKVSSAYANRAATYNVLGHRQKAEEDYKKSIALDPRHAQIHVAYAQLLIADNRQEQALEELKAAIGSDRPYYLAHLELGKFLSSKDPLQALFHLEEASKLVRNPDEQTNCLLELLELQEKLGRIAGAMISIARLIDLNPTSSKMDKWKQRFARLRLAYQAEAQKYRIEGGEASLAAIARTVLDMAGWRIDHAGLQWIRAVSEKLTLISPLPILLLDVPQVTEALIHERIVALQNDEKEIKRVVVFTAAEVIDREARIYLAQCQYPVAFITAVELREAVMKGEQSCSRLLSNALERAAERGNPFKYTRSVQERFEFFGRERQKEDFTSALLRHELVGLYGIHKIGKSSFLLQVRQHLAVYARNITPVWVEMSAAIKNPADLYKKILGELYREIGKSQQSLLSAEQFRQELYAFQQSKQHDLMGHQILLILDEYPYLIPGKSSDRGITDYMEVLGLFKVLSQEGWFNFLPCGRTTALSRAPHWPEGENPFIGMLQERFLGPLSQDEIEELVQVQGFKAGLTFKSEAIERIWALAGGHPFFTRTLGSWIIEKTGRSSRISHTSPVSAEIVDDAVQAYLHSGHDIALLRKIYQQELEDEERRIVKILAASERPMPRTVLIPDNASREHRANIRMSVDNLLATSVLKEDEQRYLSHSYELLRRLILLDVEEARLYGTDDL